MTPASDVTVFLLPRRRADGHRAALTSRLHRIGLRVSPVLTRDTAVVLVGMGSGAVPVDEIARSVSTTPAPHVGIGGELPTERDVLDAALAGLQGWLPATISDGAMVSAVLDVAAGGTAWRRGDMGILIRALQRQFRKQVVRRDGTAVELTAREYEVLELLADGESTNGIAVFLGISSGTVRWYVASIVRRLGATDRGEAVRLFGGNRHAAAS